MADEILINEASGVTPQKLDSRTKNYGGTLRERQVAIIGDLAGEGLGAITEAEASGDGTVIALLKRLRSRADLEVTALQLIDDAIHALDASLSKVVAVGAQFDDTSPATVTENSVHALRMSPERSLHVELRNGTGEIGVSGTPVRVDPTGTTTQPVKEVVAGTATLANVNDTASSTTLQASNTNRLGWSCFNDSTQTLMLKFGATASATSFTVRMAAGAYYEMPKPIYTGVIDGIWAADASGAARVTELTA